MLLPSLYSNSTDGELQSQTVKNGGRYDLRLCSQLKSRSSLHFHSFPNKQNEIEALKAENDRLKSSGNATPTATPVKTARPPSETSSTSSSSSRQSLGLSLNNLNITDTIMSGQFTVTSGVCRGESAQEESRGWSNMKWMI